jgi:hypothetical protein
MDKSKIPSSERRPSHERRASCFAAICTMTMRDIVRLSATLVTDRSAHTSAADYLALQKQTVARDTVMLSQAETLLIIAKCPPILLQVSL